MKYMRFVISFLTVSVFYATTLAFAGHDHGGVVHDSMGQTPSQSQANVQVNKVSEELLKSCAQHVESIQRNIARLQAKVAENRAVSTINDELQILEQQLKEAKNTVRALQVY